jgi:hypothetical protein
MDHLYGKIAGAINWELIEAEVRNVSYGPGVYIPVDVQRLIDEIYVSPGSPDWFLELIQSVCAKFALNRSPRRSDVLSSPIR